MSKTINPSSSDFLFLPLGGSGEIGMNLNLYGHNDQWLVVDLGITFGDRFGIDIITPDPSFLMEKREKIAGLIITHAHEDHVGAVPYLWPLLRCPIYATPFTATIIRQKIKSYAWARDVQLIEVPLSGSIKVGHFNIEYITLTHSIPEPNALAITTPLGTVLHSGDWKIDPSPLVGEATDHSRLTELGDKGVLALVCDSTNVFTPGVSGSEKDVQDELVTVMGKYPTQRLTVACFSSNVARLETVAKAAKLYGRHVALVGRSLERMTEAAFQNGYLKELDAFIPAQEAVELPPEKVVFISTGSQGEPRSALARIAAGQHSDVKLGKKDVVIFSSRIIPGNEKSISFMQNNLVRKGVKIVTAHEADIHVSGHPARDELKQMYEWIRPQILIPVHGEMRHMMEQADLGLSLGIPKAIVPENGTVIQLDPKNPQIIERVAVGRWGYDGNRMIPMVNPILADRGRMAISGAVFVTICLDKSGRLSAEPHISLLGLLEGKQRDKLENDLSHLMVQTLNGASFKGVEVTKELLRVALRRRIKALIDKKPQTEIHILVK